MIAIKGRTQSWSCFRSRYAWRWQLIENANTQADEWEECWVYTAWKDYLPHFRRLWGGGEEGRRGGGEDERTRRRRRRRMRLVFLQRGNQTNWIWGIAVPLGRACCLQRQCDTAGLRHRHNKTLIRQQQGHGKNCSLSSHLPKKIPHLYKYERKPPNFTSLSGRRSLSVISHTDVLLPNFALTQQSTWISEK